MGVLIVKVLILANGDLTGVGPLDHDAPYDVLPKDSNENVALSDETNTRFLGHDTCGNLVMSEKLRTLLGAGDLVIIDTDDALLIASGYSVQKVRDIYQQLAGRPSEQEIANREVYRPWGKYSVLEEGEGYKAKRISVAPGKRLSLQRHRHRSEHWVIVQGTAYITVEDKDQLLEPGESIFVPAGSTHRLENPGKVVLEVIETQIGDYLGEDDIERIEDDYGRSSEDRRKC